MSLVPFATRLPESKRSYIRYKAMYTGKDIQDLVDEIIDFYQRHDSEFMKLFTTLSPSTDSTVGIGDNDQESLDAK